MPVSSSPQHDAWFSSALTEYEGALIRYARRIVGDDGRAMEVVQETFLKLYQEDASQLNGRLGQWLYTVCRNQAVDVRRKESRVVTMGEAPVVADGAGDSTRDVELADDMVQVLDAISQLPANQQECIRLKFQQGMSYKQISTVTGHSATNVGFLIHVGMKTLRQRLRRAESATT